MNLTINHREGDCKGELFISKDDMFKKVDLESGAKIIIVQDKIAGTNFKIKLEDFDTFEYFCLKMGRYLQHYYWRPGLKDRIDTARMKAILLNRELNKIKLKNG